METLTGGAGVSLPLFWDFLALVIASPIPLMFFGLCCMLQAYRHQDAWWRAGSVAGYLIGIFVVYRWTMEFAW